MNFLVIGLGSMGKRRIRCLKTLGHNNIWGFDPKTERRDNAKSTYNINTVESLDSSLLKNIDAFIISTPPDKHTEYAKLAIDYNRPAFIEASVILEDVQEIKKYNNNKTFLAPSCTLRFHPVIKDITKIIKEGNYGKVTNFSYHSGQFLPDWHPWENVRDFYVSNRKTGGGREIVPFELTWIVDTIGWPLDAKGVFEKTIDTGADIDDSYAFTLKYNGSIGSIVVDVAARYATRSLIINLELGQIQWRWDESAFYLYESENNRWIKYNQPEFASSSGYNKNIGEQMYVEEVEHFIKGIKDQKSYPNTIDDDIKVLQILEMIEKSDGGFLNELQ
ncbi:MAG: Gfo/Idh/MocA family oxidoreductase [Bacteroidales bacterium]|nr:Gfo/Idh/MocA family oxidoreductase [Bacteroidales bacterium]